MRALIATLLLTFPVAGLSADNGFPEAPEPTKHTKHSKTQDFPNPTVRSSSSGPVLQGYRYYIPNIPMLSEHLNAEAPTTPAANAGELTEWEDLACPPAQALPPATATPRFHFQPLFGPLPSSTVPTVLPPEPQPIGIAHTRMFSPQQCPDYTGDYRVQRVYRLRHQSAARVARQVEAGIKECFPPSLQALAQTAGFKVVVVPEPVTNSLIVSAPQCATLAIAAKISEFDRAPQRYQIDLKISQGESPAKKKLISSPKLVTHAGQKATIQISQSDGKTLELELTIVGLDVDSPKPKKNARKPGKVVLRKSHPYQAFTCPRPLTVTSHRHPPLQSSSGTVLPLPQESPARIRLTSGVTSFTRDVPRPQASNALTVRRYPVSDLLSHKSGRQNSLSAETIQEFIKVGVEPHSWQSAGGSCSLILLKSTKCLLIRHNAAGHRQVRELLQALRTAHCGPLPNPLPFADDPHIQRFSTNR